MSPLLRLVVCACGAGLFVIVIQDLVNKKLNEKQSLFWLSTGFILFLLGLFPGLTGWFANLFGVVYAPSMIFFATSVMAVYGIYRCYRSNAELEQRVNELATQVSLLNHENDLRNKENKK